MFSNFFLKSFRILLLPFAVIFWAGIAIRNFLYNKNILRSTHFNLPVICIGNLSTGGTGKSPMVEYLLRSLQGDFSIATLSRGYKRKTRGYALAGKSSTALDIGDEPMQFHRKFPGVAVAVGEQRILAVPQILHDVPATNLIILDDAFQHRQLRAGYNILLTDFNDLYTRDFYLPTGDLRDQKTAARRADMIVVTKCDAGLSAEGRKEIIKEISPLPAQEVFFATLQYSIPLHLDTGLPFLLTEDIDVLLITGIANPKPLQRMLERHSGSYQLIQFPDHHIFTIDDLREVKSKFDQLDSKQKIILTTEKDAVRLEKFTSEIAALPFYSIAIEHRFLFDEEDKFISLVRNFIHNFHH